MRHRFTIFFGLLLSLLITTTTVQAQLREQIVSDLITVGITGAATLSGNVPLALASGVISKYLVTYGIQGYKALINKFKGESPQDLGEINIYFIYLIHVKRNLYQTLINIRTNVKTDPALATLSREIDELEKEISGACHGKCEVTGLDEGLVNFEFMNMALDAKNSFDIFNHIETQQVKATYHYLMLLYLDIIIVEQKLLEGQYNALATQVADLVENLEKNAYMNNGEKEYVFQLSMNLVLKWQRQRDHRRVILLTALKTPMQEMQEENERIEGDLTRYQDLNDDLKFLRKKGLL